MYIIWICELSNSVFEDILNAFVAVVGSHCFKGKGTISYIVSYLANFVVAAPDDDEDI